MSKTGMVTKKCDKCNGTGFVTALCLDCGGSGYIWIDKETYYKQLRMEQKHRKEVDK